MRTPGDVRVQKRRKRFGAVLVAGLLAFIAGFVPSFYLWPIYRWAPMLSMVTSVTVVIFMTFRSTGLRQGIIRGLILGLMGGGGSFAGMSDRLDYIDAHINPGTTQPASTQPTQPTTGLAATQPATGPASTQPTQPTPLGPFSKEEWAQLVAEFRRRLPIMCLLPNMLVGTVTGAAFGRSAQRRRRRTSATWQ